MTKFRKGDVVSIEVTVASDYIHNDTIKVMAGGYNDFFIETAGMTMVRPVLKNGDMVWNRQLQHFGTILSIHGERLWVEADSDTFPTWLFGDVDRVEPPMSDEVSGTVATSIFIDEIMQPPSCRVLQMSERTFDELEADLADAEARKFSADMIDEPIRRQRELDRWTRQITFIKGKIAEKEQAYG